MTRVVLVTGATSNVGLATARAFAAEGAALVVTARTATDVASVAEEVGGTGHPADLAAPDDIAALFRHVGDLHGRLDVLVNAAAEVAEGDVAEATVEEWDRAMAVNLRAPFLAIRHAVPLMRRGGAIVNVTAGSATLASPGRAAYSVSKGGLDTLTRQAAVDLAPQGIRVNAVVLGPTGTPMGRRDADPARRSVDGIPLGRIARPEEAADAIVFLASERASFITGALLPVDGGRTMSQHTRRR